MSELVPMPSKLLGGGLGGRGYALALCCQNRFCEHSPLTFQVTTCGLAQSKFASGRQSLADVNSSNRLVNLWRIKIDGSPSFCPIPKITSSSSKVTAKTFDPDEIVFRSRSTVQTSQSFPSSVWQSKVNGSAEAAVVNINENSVANRGDKRSIILSSLHLFLSSDQRLNSSVVVIENLTDRHGRVVFAAIQDKLHSCLETIKAFGVGDVGSQISADFDEGYELVNVFAVRAFAALHFSNLQRMTVAGVYRDYISDGHALSLRVFSENKKRDCNLNLHYDLYLPSRGWIVA